MIFLIVFLSIIAINDITEFITKSRLVAKVKPKEGLIGELLSCGYCFSFWLAIFFALIIGLSFKLQWYWVFLLIFTLHRGSNILNDLFRK